MRHLLGKVSFVFLACSSSLLAHEMPQKDIPAQEITPTAGPRIARGPGIFITGDFIYWLTRQDGLEYLYSGRAAPGVVADKTTIKKPNFEWSPGFKAGLGTNLPHGEWDVFAQYTFLRPYRATQSMSNGTFTAIWNNGTIIARQMIDDAKISWSFQLNVIDTEIGRNFYLSRYFKLRPFIGLKGTWNNQNALQEFFLENDDNARVRLRERAWGVGVRTGLNQTWQISRNWSFYSDLAVSSMWTEFDISRRDVLIDTNNIESNILNTAYDFSTNKLIVEWGLGVRVDVWMWKDRVHFLLQGGWEEQLWLKYNQFYNTVRESTYIARGGDLFFQGLTIKARLDF